MRCPRLPRSRGGILAAALILASSASCSPGGSLPFPPPDPDKVTLYEGLPHQLYEAERLVEERKKPCIEKGGFPFYKDPLAIEEADAGALAAILANPDVFRPFGGEKRCGGFHPDYAIAVSAKGEEFTYLICFGCREAKVYRPDGSETRYDLAPDASWQRLVAILKPYRKDRPTPIEGP